MLIDIRDGRPVGYITINEYSKKYDVKEETIRAWVRRGKIESIQIGVGPRAFRFIPEGEPLPYLNKTGIARTGRPEGLDKLAIPPDEYYTVDEFSKMTGASIFTVWQWVHRGKLKYYKVPGKGKRGRIYISKDSPIPEKTYYKFGAK